MDVPLIGPVGRLISGLDSVVRSLDEILSEFRGMRGDIAALDKQVRGLRSDVRGMSGEVAGINEAMGGIDEHMLALGESLQGVDALMGRLGRLGRRRSHAAAEPIAEPDGAIATAPGSAESRAA